MSDNRGGHGSPSGERNMSSSRSHWVRCKTTLIDLVGYLAKLAVLVDDARMMVDDGKDYVVAIGRL